MHTKTKNRIIKDTLENYPEAKDTRPIPATSLLTYIPVVGLPRVFVTDANTGDIGVNLVNKSDYPFIVTILALTILIPGLAAVAIIAVCIYLGYVRLSSYRTTRLVQEYTAKNLTTAFTSATGIEDEMGAFSMKYVKDITARTNFVYMFEQWLGVADAARSLYMNFFLVVMEISFFLVPAVIVYYGSVLMEAIYVSARCEFRPDQCTCLNEFDTLRMFPNGLYYLVYVYFVSCMIEMGLFFLCIEYNIFRRLLRPIVYLLMVVVWFFALFFVLTVILFIFIGVLVRPVWLAPYGIAILGALSSIAANYARQTKFRIRVSKAIEMKMHSEK
jgi:hypothetical protein